VRVIENAEKKPQISRLRSVENISRKGCQRRDLSAALPQISRRTCWRWQSSCAFLYGKAQSWALRVLRGRKSGYASVPRHAGAGEMTKGRAALPWRVASDRRRFSSPWVGRRPMIPLSKNISRKVRETADPSASLGMTKERARFHRESLLDRGVFHHLRWATGP
jgi:hypothetical protein